MRESQGKSGPAFRRGLAVVALSLAGCPHRVPEPVVATVTGKALGADLRIVIRCPDEEAHRGCLEEGLAARAEIERLERLASDTGATGEIARLNAAGGARVPISAEIEAMLRAALVVAEATGGAFDPTIGADAGWAGLLLDDGTASLARPGMTATLGGLARGAAADAALDRISHDALIDLSGDLAARGRWTIGLPDPRGAAGASFATIELRDAAVCTSGADDRPTGAISATVVHDDGAVADALAAALLALGPEEAPVAAFGAWALVMTPDGGVYELGNRGGRVVQVVIEPRPTEGAP